MRVREFMNRVAKQIIVIMMMISMLIMTILDSECGAWDWKPVEFILDLWWTDDTGQVFSLISFGLQLLFIILPFLCNHFSMSCVVAVTRQHIVPSELFKCGVWSQTSHLAGYKVRKLGSFHNLVTSKKQLNIKIKLLSLWEEQVSENKMLRKIFATKKAEFWVI
jgi:hypothetical protein